MCCQEKIKEPPRINARLAVFSAARYTRGVANHGSAALRLVCQTRTMRIKHNQILLIS